MSSLPTTYSESLELVPLLSDVPPVALVSWGSGTDGWGDVCV